MGPTFHLFELTNNERLLDYWTSEDLEVTKQKRKAKKKTYFVKVYMRWTRPFHLLAIYKLTQMIKKSSWKPHKNHRKIKLYQIFPYKKKLKGLIPLDIYCGSFLPLLEHRTGTKSIYEKVYAVLPDQNSAFEIVLFNLLQGNILNEFFRVCSSSKRFCNKYRQICSLCPPNRLRKSRVVILL
jgi:hypothetical protein